MGTSLNKQKLNEANKTSISRISFCKSKQKLNTRMRCMACKKYFKIQTQILFVY